MQQLISFLVRHKSFLFFLILLCVSLALTIQFHSYHKSKFINATNSITGSIHNSSNSFNEFLNLKTYNKRLLEENAQLRKKLSNYSFQTTQHFNKETPYKIIPAKLIKNSFRKKKNILLINKGKKDGITTDMGVITSNGIIGVIGNVGENYATIISILNTDSKINAQLKKSNHIGSLSWNGIDSKNTQLEDITSVTPVAVNDTVVTGNYSVFPQGIPIGKIVKANLNRSKNYYQIDLKLFNDMSTVGYVYVIKNKNKKEIDKLLNETENE